MKLIELLVKDLEMWADTTLCYVQDSNGDVWPCIDTPEFDEGAWVGPGGKFIDQNEEARHIPSHETVTADDHSTAIVTRDEWEAAR